VVPHRHQSWRRGRRAKDNIFVDGVNIAALQSMTLNAVRAPPPCATQGTNPWAIEMIFREICLEYMIFMT
jgi:hypothetical protein